MIMSRVQEDASSVVTSVYTFRGLEYIVSMNVSDTSTLTVEVEDRLTADQWRGTFDASYIEDLTHKTGNFKQFNIFVNMLESAVTKSTESVSLDLLTYADLELLRNRKAGVGTRTIPGAKAAALNTKRYLILTYTVEFDRIHYPLPLPYVGKPDPVLLQNTVRNLREEIKRLQKQGHSDFRETELNLLKKDYETLLKQKDEIESAFMQYRREVKNTSKGTAAKEVRIMKNIVKNLEEELATEKSKYRRQANKRNSDYRSLLDEVEELRASERNLRARVKSLTNELAIYKRGRISRASPLPGNSSSQKRERRSRSTSRDVRSASRDRSLSRERPSSVSSMRSNSPSPAGARNPRFNPTAYIEDKKRKMQESKLKSDRSKRQTVLERNRSSLSADRGRSRSSPYSGSAGRPLRRARSGSVGSTGSRASSLSDIENTSVGSQSARLRGIRNVLKGKTSSSSAWASPDVPMAGSGRIRSGTKARAKRAVSTPDPSANLEDIRKWTSTSGKIKKRDVLGYRPKENINGYYHNRSAEMSEIDARLNALQKFMNDNLT